MLFALAALAASAPALAQDRGLLADMGACVDTEIREYRVIDGTSAIDCATGGGTYDAICCCLNGAWASCGGSGGGNSFETIDAPAGTDPVADSATDTLQILANATGNNPAGIEVVGDSAADTLSIGLTDDCADFESLMFRTTPSRWLCTAFLTDLSPSTPDSIPCGGDQYLKRNVGDTAWECAGYAGGMTTADIDTSSELRAILTDEVGTGALMFGLATTTTDDLSCTGSQVVRRNSGDTAFECYTPAAAATITSSTLDRLTTAVNIDNDASETTVYTYTIPAGTVDANGELRLKILSEFLNNSGAGRGYTIKVKLGGTTVINYTTGSAAYSSRSERRNMTLLISLSATGATNSQIVTVEHFGTSTSSLFGTLTTGSGLTMSNAINAGFWNSGTLTTDMTASQTLAVTITLSTANVSLEWLTYAATLELLNP